MNIYPPHVEDFLYVAKDYLTAGGNLFITVPAYNFLWSNEDVEAGHFQRFSLRYLEKILQKVGFEIVYSTYIFSLLPLPILFSRTLPDLLRFKKRKQASNEHRVGRDGFVDRLLSKVWNTELKLVQNSKKIPFGGSCFIVARKCK